jgi:hypothetical protein
MAHNEEVETRIEMAITFATSVVVPQMVFHELRTKGWYALENVAWYRDPRCVRSRDV